MVTGEITAMIANTTDAAPRKPAKDTSTLRAKLPPNGAMNTNVATGRAMNVRKRAIASAGRMTSTICDGNESSPSRKNSAESRMLVTPSKNGTIVLRSGSSLFPRSSPTIYTLRNPVPPRACGTA